MDNVQIMKSLINKQPLFNDENRYTTAINYVPCTLHACRRGRAERASLTLRTYQLLLYRRTLSLSLSILRSLALTRASFPKSRRARRKGIACARRPRGGLHRRLPRKLELKLAAARERLALKPPRRHERRSSCLFGRAARCPRGQEARHAVEAHHPRKSLAVELHVKSTRVRRDLVVPMAVIILPHAFARVKGGVITQRARCAVVASRRRRLASCSRPHPKHSVAEEETSRR